MAAAGPRILKGNTMAQFAPLLDWAAAGPRILNGYTFDFRNDAGAYAAAGPRILNGYTRVTTIGDTVLLRLIAFNSAMSFGNSSGAVMPDAIPKQGENDPL
ncbi:hypothetical protein [Aliiroseovarius sp.]|uniref:hypothetical protein n=1 Tax=Aliiroseovarius sp. TaxID=1872442 RepID=UPI0026201602|nr:hypothetical protein [Aliiroseovarius sp.]